MPLIPLFAAERRFLSADGSLLLRDAVLSLRRIPASRSPGLFAPGSTVVVDPADLPEADLAAPSGAGAVHTRSGSFVVFRDATGKVLAHLDAREAVDAALAGRHGLTLIPRRPEIGGAP